ncbi:MAG: hypothetical protein NC094_07820 [Bacteroidales bacterium]|nr:hypothetical protein [Lachnoclostridium sp.]MCM1385060.1 hypothetical protein [Lachnoclostridium sp.]MCM1465308.1 hypothetical protein [Bacteroidales bacterium]
MKENQGKIWDDRGSALVTVVVITAFISIMVTIILYVAGMNYYMKNMDKKNKDSFYEAEIVMESIKANLVVEAKTAFQKSYQDTMVTFAKNTADDRRLLYNKTFVDTLNANFSTHTDPGDITVLQNYLKNLVPSGSASGIISLTVGDASGLETHEAEGYALLKDVTLEYQKDDYYTKIKTDFMIKIPKIDWSIEASATTGGSTQEERKREEYEMMDCVIYYNWTKE